MDEPRDPVQNWAPRLAALLGVAAGVLVLWRRDAVAGAVRLLDSLGHDVAESSPAAMHDEEFSRHFVSVIAADTEVTFRAFEHVLERIDR